MLSDRCLSCLSGTLVYCGQMVGWIKMKLGTQVGFGPGHTALDGNPPPPPPKGHSPPIFGSYLLRPNGCMYQDVTWIKMSLGMEVGLGPGDFVLIGDHALPSPKGGEAPLPKKKFGPCLLWPNGWMDQDATWHEGMPQPRRLCYMGTQPLPQKGAEPLPNFRPISIVAKRLDASRCHLVWI